MLKACKCPTLLSISLHNPSLFSSLASFHPPSTNFQDAIAAKQFFPTVHTISQGDVDSALTSAEHLLEGEIAVGGQDHFYMETIACVVTPRGEDGEMEIVASTQGLAGTQTMAARALGVPDNRVVAKARRIGMQMNHEYERALDTMHM